MKCKTFLPFINTFCELDIQAACHPQKTFRVYQRAD